MKRVVVAGHWDGEGGHPVGRALDAIRRGVLAGAKGASVLTLPFGGGPAFDEAVAPCRSSASFVRVPTEEASSRAFGERVAQLLRGGGTVVVEGGHGPYPDCGLGFLAGLLGADDSTVQGSSLGEALTRAEELVRETGVDLVCAASTARPLLGLDSVLAVGPDLQPIRRQERALTALLTRAFAHRPLHRRPLLAGPDTHPARARGSGAGGGVGGVIAAIGGRIVPTGELLAQLTPLADALDGANLLIVAEPELSLPLLSESTLDSVTGAAALRALPVVGVTPRSSLSHFERAQWGLHGVFETKGSITLEEAGRRIARTWLR